MTGYASDDTISLRHLPRRSSKKCDLQFANNDRFKANYSIDYLFCVFFYHFDWVCSFNNVSQYFGYIFDMMSNFPAVSWFLVVLSVAVC